MNYYGKLSQGFFTCIVFLVISRPGTLLPQTDQPRFNEFEVASLRLSVPVKGSPAGQNSLSGGPGSSDPGHIISQNFPLESLLLWSFSIKRYQLAAPAWVQQRNYDITAKVPDGVTMAEVHSMLQNLLIERLQIKLHHETRLLQGYEVTVAKAGIKMKEGVTLPNAGGAEIAPPSKDENGLPQLPPGRTAMKSVVLPNGLTRTMARLSPISVLVNMMGSHLDGPTVDNTGLTAKYDFVFDYDPKAMSAASTTDAGPDLVTAIKGQLGLQVAPKRIPVDVLVIDSVVEKQRQPAASRRWWRTSKAR